MTIAQLAPKPSVTQEAKQGAEVIIQDLLKMQAQGDIVEMVVLAKHPDGGWSHHYTASMDRPTMIGRLAIVQYSMSKKYLETE